MQSERTRALATLPDREKTAGNESVFSSVPTIHGLPRVAEPRAVKSRAIEECPVWVWASRRASSAALASSFPIADLLALIRVLDE